MNVKKQYEAYIACLNDRNLEKLGDFVDDQVVYNGSPIGLNGYYNMLAGNYLDIPDLRFSIDLVVADADIIGTRLIFDCHPVGEFLGYKINGRRVLFYENVFYRFSGQRIVEVWSVIDAKAIEKQLAH